MPNNNDDDSAKSGRAVRVIHVLKKDAKAAKKALADTHHLYKNFRMVPSVSDANCIAIPVTGSFDHENGPWSRLVQSTGSQVCPYSSSMLGNNRRQLMTETISSDLTSGQKAMFQVIQHLLLLNPNQNSLVMLEASIRDLDSVICPKKLETFGDDKTLVLSPGAFEGPEFDSVLKAFQIKVQEFWSQLSRIQNTNRIARRGTVDPNSQIRQSGHRLVWPHSQIPETTGSY